MEEFLKEQHAKDYTGTDDDMPDAFESWLAELTSDEFITYADQYAQSEVEKSVKSVEMSNEIANSQLH
jgi:hypothetical protein